MSVSTAIDCTDLTTRQINRAIRAALAAGERAITVDTPEARHNLAVGLTEPASLLFNGSVGYFCGGMMDGPSIQVQGNCGWSVGECMLSGEIVVEGYAGNSAGASLRGGTIVVHGDAGARAGIALKGGVLIVGGSVGYMSGFMMQKGIMIICGDAGPAIGDSMYDGTIYVGGTIEALGSDAVLCEPDDADSRYLATTLAQYRLQAPAQFKKIRSGRRLWNFSKKEMDLWISAL